MDILEKKFLNIAIPCAQEENCVVHNVFFCKKKSILDVAIERLDNKVVTIEDCVRVTKNLKKKILEFDPCSECDYTIKVGSPGQNRRLKTLEDFIRFKGKKIVTEIFSGGIEKIERVEGRILSVTNDRIALECFEEDKKKEIMVSYACIRKARLIF